METAFDFIRNFAMDYGLKIIGAIVIIIVGF